MIAPKEHWNLEEDKLAIELNFTCNSGHWKDYVRSVKKWALSLTQPHKIDSVRWGLHPLIYYERL